ncbi:hypothetical protein ABZ912_27990 [Nonomuraea angiospora]|uniref:hypothetical protein n=1 Tax=Nonomuraea angiospora TaxID=46172 RepID=UPI003411C1BA
MTGKETTARDPIARRSVLLGAAAGAGALTLGAGPLVPQAEAATFVKGADISWIPQMEANGYYLNNSAGQRQDLTGLKGYGITAISLRTCVDPSNHPGNGHRSISRPAQMTDLLKAAYDRSEHVFLATPVMVHRTQPQNLAADSLRAFITGLKDFGGLGTFFREPEGYPSFNDYNSSAWDPTTRRPTAAMDGFLNV